MSLPRRAVILGANGPAGGAIARALLARGVAVTAAVRDPARLGSLPGLPVAIAPGDAESPAQVEAWVGDHDVVIDAAAPYPTRMFHRPGEPEPVGYATRRMRTLVEVVARRGATLALIGSFVTLPHPDTSRGARGPELLRRLHPYFAVKQAIEAVIDRAVGDGLAAVIVSPTAFLGPWDSKPRRHCFLPRLLAGEVVATTDQVVNILDVRDLAEAVVLALIHERYGTPIPLAGHNLTMRALAERACIVGGRPCPRLRASSTLAAAVASWGEVAATAVGIEPVEAALPFVLARYSYPMAPSQIQRGLGVVIRPLADTLTDAIDWYRAAGYV